MGFEGGDNMIPSYSVGLRNIFSIRKCALARRESSFANKLFQVNIFPFYESQDLV